MKKLLPIVLVVLLGGGAYMAYSSRTTTTPSTESENTTQTASEEVQEPDFKGTLAAAVKLGVPLKCTYSSDAGSGEGYIKGKNYRGSMRTKDGMATEILMKDTCMWTWSAKTPGMKMCYDSIEAQAKLWQDMADKVETTPAPKAPTPTSPSMPNVEYTCKPTLATEDMFEPPTDVTFTDLSEMMKPGALPDMSKLKDLMKQP